MPCLNVVNFIEQCIKSVINQSLADIEILAIDAGSTDGTVEILEKYELHDDRIRLIRSERKSYGFQVNLGISLAVGDYIGIVEPDDYIEFNMYEKLHIVALESKADYVKGCGVRFLGLPSGTTYYSKIEVFTKKEYAANDGFVYVNPSIMPELILKDYYLWSGLYRNNFIKRIRLNETPGAAYQDIGFLFQVFCKAKKAVYWDEIVYNYRQDNPNASGYNPKAFCFLVDEYEYADILLQNQNEMWHVLSCCKMFRQTNQRIRLMAIAGNVWDSAMSHLHVISNKLKKVINDNKILVKILSPGELSQLELMIQSPMALYDYYKDTEKDKSSEVQALINRMSADQRIIIFGCGLLGKFVHVLLELNGIDNIEAYCDNNSDLWGKTIQGRPVISPKQAVRDYAQAVFLIANKTHRQEMKNQLKNLNISENNIYQYTLNTDLFLLNKFYLQNQ